MKNLKLVIREARLLALKEIKKTTFPSILNFETSNKKGQDFAKKLKADKDLVMLGTILMDLKLGECLNQGKVKEHVSRSTEASKKFLKKFNLDQKTFDKIINCVEAHHGTKKFICIEAEICANADCYRFIAPKNVFEAISVYLKEGDTIDEALDHISMKMEEKHNILSLNLAKKELEPYYQQFKILIKRAQK